MKRVFVIGGAWSLVLVIGSICLAVDPKKQTNQPAASPAPAASGGLRYLPPSNNSGLIDTTRRAADARRAAQAAAARAAAAQNAAAGQAARSTSTTPSSRSSQYNSNYPYSGYGYSSYGYNSPYGYPYSPYGTTPYMMAYDPYTGATYFIPYQGGYSPYSNYSPYANRYAYYSNPNLGYGYPGAVFVNPGQLYGLGPIQQLMGVYGWFNP
jgi:hypothetical protein